MAERIVSIKLRADATGLVQGFNQASDAVVDLGGKVKQSAMTNRQEWATVGQGLAGVGIAITGMGAAVLKTGIQYNTLQQVSRAALSSILGGAQAANAQMDKLDEFARNSPFAKQTFIQAQQQMLAFGIETQKVIPYLDAVQNAVAAAGGSNAEIEGIVATMSKIQSSAKLTAQDLNEFGNRGVNAAELIGSQMGMTGAQIRSEITAGSLDATKALDALVAGMAQQFDGAAANVKDTFAGAMDRVKAAWRDFSAELATPLVDPNGGGALIDLLNWAADMMRAFEDLPGPVKTTVSTLTGLVGVGALLTGTAMLAIPKWLEFTSAMKSLGWTAGNLKNGLSGLSGLLKNNLALGLVAAGLAWQVFNRHIENGYESQTKIAAAIKSTTDSAKGLELAAQTSDIERWWSGGDEVTNRLNNLGETLERTAGVANNFWSHAWHGTQNADIAVLDSLERWDAGLIELAHESLPAASDAFVNLARDKGVAEDQLGLLLDRMPEFKAHLEKQAFQLGINADETNLLKLATGELQVVTDDAGNSMAVASFAAEDHSKSLHEIQGAAVEVTAAVAGLADEIAGFGDVSIDSGRAALKFEDELAKLESQVANSAGTLDRGTEAGRANEASLYDMAEATNRAAGAAQAAGEDQEVVNGILQRGRDALIKAAEAYGMSRAEAEAFADQVSATPETVATHIRLTGYNDAMTQLNQLTATRTVGIRVQGDYGSGSMTRAYGGTVGYASGGTIPGAANGMTFGIGGGVNRGTVFGQGTAKSDSVLVRLSKGEEVIQQPYAGMNRDLLKSINRGDFHQGMMQPQVVVAGSSAPTQVSLTGARLTLDVDGRQISAVIREQIVDASRSGSSESLNNVLGTY